MLLKPGVDISQLKPQIRKKLTLINNIFQKYRDEMVITSTYGGNHAPGSLHYAHLAIDLRLPARNNNIEPLSTDIRSALGSDYDVILETDHIHIEYDP